jgi:phytoene dehydrogenase-like protein
MRGPRVGTRAVTEAIVIGAGHNGLVAANILADGGREVLVLEEQPEPGGAVRSGELTLPGYRHDRFSSFYPLGVASPVMRSMELERFGVRWRRHPIPVAHPGPEGLAAYVSADPDETRASLDAFAPGDGDRFARWMEYWHRIGPRLLDALFSPFPPLRGGARLAGVLGPRGLLEFGRLGMLSVRRFGEEEFRGEGARRLFAGNALHADFMPESPGSAVYGLVLCGLAAEHGYPIPEGGGGAITDALVRRLGARGRIECGVRVERIVVRGGRAAAVRTADGRELEAEAIIGAIDAPQLLGALVGTERLPEPTRRGLERFQWDNSTVKLDFALSGPIGWTAPGTERAGTVHVADSVDALTEATAQLSRGLVPRRPFLVAGQYTRADPTRAPAGAEVFWAYTHVPREVRGDAGEDGLTGAWDEREAELIADRMTEEVERLAPGFRALVRDRRITTPAQLQEQNRSLDRGSINGGTAQLWQQLVWRPIPGLARPETAVPGLYLGSSSAHPGGGVHGAAGANAARAVLHTRPLHMLGRPFMRR